MTGMKGEKTKERAVGIVVERIKLITPKLPPSKAPIFGPKTIEPIITGICIVVAFNGPIGINPKKGTDASKIIIPKNNAVKTN